MHDNPDVEGNQKQIKADKNELMVAIEHCMEEMKELSYGNFRKMCQKNIEIMGKYEQLKEQERDFMAKIK